MNWEPMTEDAVFEDYEDVLVFLDDGMTYLAQRNELDNYNEVELFYCYDGPTLGRSTITHFARITNPNEVKP